MSASARPPVLVVGMARSGTTLTIDVFAQAAGVHVEIEPHLLWKLGDFHRLADEAPAVDATRAEHIRTTLLARAGDKLLVEKSPPNSLRPELVHAAFPDARIVVVDRDPAACIRSNLAHTHRGRGWDLMLSVRRYGGFATRATRRTDVRIPHRRLAAWQQLRLAESPSVAAYMARMAYLKARGRLPFGPKLQGFASHVRDHGFLAYHVEVHRRWRRHRRRFFDLYGPNAAAFRLEDMLANPAEVTRLLDFAGVPKDAYSAAAVSSHFRRPPPSGAQAVDDPELEAIRRELDRAVSAVAAVGD